MQIHLPGIFVDRIVQATTPKEIEIETLAPEPGSDDKAALGSGEARQKRELIVKVRMELSFESFNRGLMKSVYLSSELLSNLKTDSTSTLASESQLSFLLSSLKARTSGFSLRMEF